MVKTHAQAQATYQARKRALDPSGFKADNRAKMAKYRAKKKADQDELKPDGPMRASLAKQYVGTFQNIMDDARTAGEGKGPGAVAVPVARAVHKGGEGGCGARELCRDTAVDCGGGRSYCGGV